MRDIKFRGKRLDNGEWVYGDLVNHPDGRKSICSNPARYGYGAVEGFLSLVDPDTVGQYTGLKDKNNKEIYEGDILRYSDGKILGVTFDNKTAQFTTKTRWLWTIIDVCEIVGNIHENLELLEGER